MGPEIQRERGKEGKGEDGKGSRERAGKEPLGQEKRDKNWTEPPVPVAQAPYPGPQGSAWSGSQRLFHLLSYPLPVPVSPRASRPCASIAGPDRGSQEARLP